MLEHMTMAIKLYYVAHGVSATFLSCTLAQLEKSIRKVLEEPSSSCALL